MRGSDGELFDLVGEIRQLVTVMMQIEKDLKKLIKQGEPEEKTTNGGNEK